MSDRRSLSASVDAVVALLPESGEVAYDDYRKQVLTSGDENAKEALRRALDGNLIKTYNKIVDGKVIPYVKRP